MLYVSTRNKADTNTAYKTLYMDNTLDGGVFAPLCVCAMEPEQLETIKKLDTAQIIARILNRFFPKHLKSEQIEEIIGADPFKVQLLNQRTIAGELWHNDAGDNSYVVNALNALLTENEEQKPSAWARITIEVAVLFALFAQLSKQGIEDADIVVASEDFTYPMAAFYARKMGLPIGSIICACDENDAVWEFVNHGRITAAVEGIERLIYETLGDAEVARYLQSLNEIGEYQVDEDSLPGVSEGLSASVIGEGRIDTVISSVFCTNNYIVDPVTAVSFGALQDFRARTGENRQTLVLSRHTPLSFVARISAASGCSQEKLKSLIRITEE